MDTEENSLSKYFTSTPLNAKRKGGPSPSSSEEGKTPSCKKAFNFEDSFDTSNKSEISTNKMADNNETLSLLKNSMEAMKKQMYQLSTKEDVTVLSDSVTGEMNKMRFEIQELKRDMKSEIEKLESRFFDVEQKLDIISAENKRLKEDNDTLNQRILKTEERINDMEQYSRRVNLRVFQLEDDPNETSYQTAEKVCKILSDVIGVPTTPDCLEACHCLPLSNAQVQAAAASGTAQPQSQEGDGGQDSSKSGPPRRVVIVKFKSRAQRDAILRNKKKAKNQGFSVGEDLTRINAALSREAFKHKACKSSWTVEGKVFALLHNGKKIRVPYGSDVNELFRKETG